MNEVTGQKRDKRPSVTIEQVTDGGELKETDAVGPIYSLGKTQGAKS